MATTSSVADYDAWYDTPRGAWISDCEFDLMRSMLRPRAGESLLDVGCGSGHFSRRFAAIGLEVSGIDPDAAAIEFAGNKDDAIHYVTGDALALPFPDNSFDYCAAVTSLCFIHDVETAVREMWRVSRKGVLLGLLNRHSLLFAQKAGGGGYSGARWDHSGNVRRWVRALPQPPNQVQIKTAVFLPRGDVLSRLLERIVPNGLPVGAFMSVYLPKN